MIDSTSVYTRGLNGAGTTDSTTGTGGTASNAAEMQNQFLTLLVAQLKNQDPTSPMDNAQMTSQMAQISTVSGIEKLNDTVNSVTSQFSTMQMLQGSNLIGRTVLSAGDQLGMVVGETEDEDGNKVPTARGTAAFDLDGLASDVQVQIMTSSGQLVDTMQLGSANPGRNYFTWDGSAYEGDLSDLRFKVTATNGSEAVKSTSLAPNAVVATSITDQGMVLELANGSSIGYSSVKAVF
ncbi:MAG: flagellar hook assembly protein FlgD [Comamonas sp.]|nr:flagellar hook assembly protein FlgD [Comamonas sp.]